MQSYVLWALMQEILANELTVARGSTAISALDNSAHFLCSRSERVHHRNFFPVGSKMKSRFVGFSKKNPQFKTLWKREAIFFYLTSQVSWFCSLTLTYPHTHRHPRDVSKQYDQDHFCPTWKTMNVCCWVFTISVCFLLTGSSKLVFR